MFCPVLDLAGRDYWPFVLWTIGRTEIPFRSLMLRPPLDDEGPRREFLRRLNQIPDVSIPEDAITKRPSIRLALLAASPEALDSFKAALDWFCETVRSGAEEKHAKD